MQTKIKTQVCHFTLSKDHTSSSGENIIYIKLLRPFAKLCAVYKKKKSGKYIEWDKKNIVLLDLKLLWDVKGKLAIAEVYYKYYMKNLYICVIY